MRDGYVPNLKVPGKKGPSHRMWLTALMCLVLPPVGLIMLWGGARCPLRGKMWLTALSVAVMVVVMTLVLEHRTQSSYVITPDPVAYTYAQPTPTVQPIPAPAQGTTDGAPGQQEVDQGLPDGVIPANPLG